jgi:hypothetical protein
MIRLFGRLIQPADGREAAFERLDDIADADLVGRANELVTAGRSPHGANKAGLPKGGEELVEVLLRHVAAQGNLR